jgi:hypothetical protein
MHDHPEKFPTPQSERCSGSQKVEAASPPINPDENRRGRRFYSSEPLWRGLHKMLGALPGQSFLMISPWMISHCIIPAEDSP